MPLGGVVAEIVGSIIGEFIWDGLAKHVLWPIMRFPGAVLGWCIWRGRTFSQVWNKQDKFAQTVAGLAFWVLVIGLLLIP